MRITSLALDYSGDVFRVTHPKYTRTPNAYVSGFTAPSQRCCESSPGCFDGNLKEKIFFLKEFSLKELTQLCLGHDHGEAAFGEGLCSACEDMPLSMLRLRVAFFTKKPRLTSTASSSSQYELEFLFGASAGEEEVTAASEGGLEASAELASAEAVCRSAADAEMVAVLERAAKEIRLEPRSTPVLFLPEVHEELTKSWRAPFSARMQYTNSSSLTTLDGAPARGYMEVSQVERAIAVHLCPQKCCHLVGPPETPSRRSMRDLQEGVPDPELLQKLHSVTDYALRVTGEQGRAMSTMWVQERHLWLNLVEMWDAEKVSFLDAPISQVGLFGDTVEEFAQQFSTVKKQMQAIKHNKGSNPHLLSTEEGPLPEQLRSCSKSVLQLDPPNGPVLAGRCTTSSSTGYMEPLSGFKAFLRQAAQRRGTKHRIRHQDDLSGTGHPLVQFHQTTSSDNWWPSELLTSSHSAFCSDQPQCPHSRSVGCNFFEIAGGEFFRPPHVHPSSMSFSLPQSGMRILWSSEWKSQQLW
ncbi:Proline--tRNA ligase [Labeo rohita]|uniref:Proline--tRNA ligase n=1 Tax=Labeo rohita TaxID=84645 RepID=A0ABQ8LQ77_LABRO|nr:Proline--tRNA ligase [Labeo rohita]